MKTQTRSFRAGRRASPRCSQRGVVLLFSLIALTVMLVGAVALIGSMNTSLASAGNLGFKRDLQNQGEQATAKIYNQFIATTGVFYSATGRANTQKGQNYSAVVLPTNAQGIPNDLLLKDSAFTASPASWSSAQDIDISSQKVKIRYLIDRLCVATTEGKIAQATKTRDCIRAPAVDIPQGGTNNEWNNATAADEDKEIPSAIKIPVVYRISVRVFGPRNTEAYFQSTFAERL
jgi:type IV pilus assembly protein PilX